MKFTTSWLGAALTAVSFAAPASAQIPIAGQFVVGGLNQPLFVTHAPGDATRLFVVEKIGVIRVVENGVLLPAPYLDVSGLVQTFPVELGLLGLCFDPNYASNGFCYVCLSELGSTDTIIARFTVTTDPAVADPGSMAPVLRLVQLNTIHRAGWLDFGPDGFLYASFGDGGGQNDPSNRAQDLTLLHGKIVRIDVTGDDFPADVDNNYAIPQSNPFVGQPGVAGEIWAFGLRNPWRCSFDRLTHDLYIGDVGGIEREEISFIAAGTSGQNFGWRCTEGTTCTGLTGCVCNGTPLTAPIHEYSHQVGRAIAGGYVYRGSAIAGLQGAYFFADWAAARVWSLRYDGTSVTEFTERTAELVPPTGQTINSIAAFGEDLQGELYVVDLGGELFKIVGAADTTAPQIAITSPTNAPFLDASTSPLTLSGTASDAVGVTQVTWTSAASGSGTALGTTSWSVAGLALAPGGNSFTVTARDAAGNTSSSSIHVRYFPPAESFCPGDGTLVACPCGNSGASASGCANSVFASGARLVAGGSASVSGDSASLIATELTGPLAIFVQGATQQAPALIDDGIFCTGNPLVRLGNMPIGGNGSVYPEGVALPISVRGMLPAFGGDYAYQVFYRNADVTYCPPATSNRSNGVILHWIP